MTNKHIYAYENDIPKRKGALYIYYCGDKIGHLPPLDKNIKNL